MGLKLDYIYGQTPLSLDEKHGLRIKTISTKTELDEFEQNNIESAIGWTMRRTFDADKIFTFKFISDVHIQMFGNVWSWAGDLRKTNKNIGVDKLKIRQQLKILFDDCKFWIEKGTFTPDEIAIRFKHGLVWIHPFPNGNGRHSRLCADIVISHIFEREMFSWGHSELDQSGENRKKYLSVLRQADTGNIKPLVKFARS